MFYVVLEIQGGVNITLRSVTTGEREMGWSSREMVLIMMAYVLLQLSWRMLLLIQE